MARDVKCGVWRGEPYRYAHVKRDGMWVTLLKTPDGVTKAWSRMPRDLTPKLSWHGTFEAFASQAPSNTITFCEAFVVGGDREDVKAAMRDEDQRLVLECFAIDKVDNIWVPVELGLQEVGDVALTLGLVFTRFRDWEPPVCHCGMLMSDHTPHGGCTTPVEMGALSDIQPDSEGWVVKDGNLLNWRKVKPQVTYDLRVIGFTDGREGRTGKMLGLIGAIIVADASGEEVAKVSGMTDEVRLDITSNKSAWLGRVIEVEAQGRGKAGGLMHPRFLRLRDDKDTVDALT